MKELIRNKKAVLFDLDGTLIDSMWMWKAIDIEYLGRFGIDIPDNLQSEIEGKSFHETALYFKDRFDIKDDPEIIKNDWNNMALDIYKNRVSMKPGAFEFLCYLKENNIKTAIATSNSRVLTDTALESLNIKNMFDAVITACEVSKGKPAPDIYLKAAELVDVCSDDCIVFEDIPHGIMAGKNAGMTVVAVDDMYSSHYKDEKIEISDYYINDYFQILNNGD